MSRPMLWDSDLQSVDHQSATVCSPRLWNLMSREYDQRRRSIDDIIASHKQDCVYRPRSSNSQAPTIA